MLTVSFVAPFHTRMLSLPGTKVSGVKGSTGEWKMLENDGHVPGEGDAGYSSGSCFDQINDSLNLCIPQCPHLEENTFCMYVSQMCFFFLIRDYGILESFIIKRLSRSIHCCANIGRYNQVWYLHKLAQSQLLFVCSPSIHSKYEATHFPVAAVTLLSVLGITVFI